MRNDPLIGCSNPPSPEGGFSISPFRTFGLCNIPGFFYCFTNRNNNRKENRDRNKIFDNSYYYWNILFTMDYFLDCQVGGGIYEMMPDGRNRCDEVV